MYTECLDLDRKQLDSKMPHDAIDANSLTGARLVVPVHADPSRNNQQAQDKSGACCSQE